MNKNKNFRKSAIVIPALALMVLTAGASATGAVAWFTANRAATATASKFSAYSSNSDLGITASAVAGTFVDTSDNKTISVKGSAEGNDHYLRDASFDASKGVLYRAVFNDETSTATPDSYQVVSSYDSHVSVSVNSVTHEIFYAVQWTYTFTYKSSSSNGSALLFDNRASSFKANTGEGINHKIDAGFRIAFSVGTLTSPSKYLVFANDATTSYINGTTSSSTGNYSSPNLITADPSATLYEDGDLSTTDVASTAAYLGTFANSTDATTIIVTCTAWYEGTDAAVISSNADAASALTASLKFYVRDLKA